MKIKYIVFPFLTIMLAWGTRVAAQSDRLHYPDAQRTEYSESYHGVEVHDPYHWMENLESDRLRAWMHQQDSLRDRYFSDSRVADRIKQRLDQLGNLATRTVPVEKNGKLFYSHTEPGASYGIYYVKAPGQNPRPLFDFNTYNDDRKSGNISSVSKKGTYFTLNTRENQSRWGRVRVYRTADSEALPEMLEGFYGGASNIAWNVQETGFYYTRYEVPENPQDPLGLPQIYFHELNTPQQEDRLVYERPDVPQLAYSLRTTDDGRYLIISASESGGSFNGMFDRIFYKNLVHPAAEVAELFPGIDANFSYEGNEGSRFQLRTTHGASNAKLVSLDIEDPEPSQWEVLIPETEYAMQGLSKVGSHFIIQYNRDARSAVSVYDSQGRHEYDLGLLAPSFTGLPDNPDGNITFYRPFILHDLGTIYKLNVETGESEIYFRPDLQHDPEAFEMKQVFYRSKDGTRVPMYLVYRKGLELDGSNPLFMYAYGVWAWSAFPWQRHMIPWMEMGGVYAVPNIRGGGEYGESWHQAGIRENKQNGVDDYIAAAEWLIENGYTSRKKIVANGGSASGMLPAVAVNRRPDLFAASVINFPALDMVRYTQFGSAASWIPEFGDPAEAEEFNTLYSYSPYHNLKDRCYPPTWIQVGENDNTTTPMHGYKYTAELQHRQQCGNPVILKITWAGGHGYGVNPDQRRQTMAEELAFLVKVLEMDPML